ncbi:MAG: GTP 3',8-cyclase MoaA [Gemmatimonadota bacterium]|nr:MAG: GTP 3',8-cyclase MoaA [Gemmatimonadota bacterium]
MRDQFGRQINYLRISVTDKCNLRCTYCLPTDGLEWIPKPEMLSFEEITEIVRQMAGAGLTRVRLTGGEPLVRRDLPVLADMLASVPGILDVSLSTNAVLLPQYAADLRRAGIQRINVSLDTLRRDRFTEITYRPGRFFDATLEGLAAAEETGFRPIKINTVMMRGINDDEFADFAQLTRSRPWHVRFIELMPVGRNLHLADRFIPASEMLRRLESLGGLKAVEGPIGNGPARYFQYKNAAGTVGVITPLSHNYCDRCNRMRLTADGRLRTCLFGSHEVDLKTPLRAHGEVLGVVRAALDAKQERHWLQLGTAAGSGGLSALSQVGG